MNRFMYKSCSLILILLVISSCKKEQRPITPQPPATEANSINGTWNLLRIYGGIAGINETHNPGDIEWTFNTQDSSLTVDNNGFTSDYFHLPSGTYSFHEISTANEHYLVIESNELGQFTISGNQLFIDENKKSSGEGACGFYLKLER